LLLLAILAGGRTVPLLAGVRDFSFRFAEANLVAFWARAFPAGERLVAGLRRVDFFAASTRLRECAVPDEWRVADREVDLFVVILMH
jgi:hypothetical protein